MKLSQAGINKHWDDMFHGNKNPFSPDVIKIDQTDDEKYIYELSSGDDMNGRTMYAVTVIELGGYGTPNTHRHDLSQPFFGDDAKKQALKHIKEL